ncbi:MAG: ABC transporter ATP-binding protein [Candidatus Woesearchaeota archaeon]
MDDKPDPDRIDFQYNLKIYFGMLKKYKMLFIFLLLIVLIVEATYVADRFLFKVIVDRGTEYGAGTLSVEGLIHIMSIVAIIYASIVLVKSSGKWLMLRSVNKLESNLITDVKIRFFNHLVTLSHKFHTNNKTGSMISRLSRGGRAIERMTDIITFNVAPLIFQLVIVSVSMMAFDLTSGLIVFLTVTMFIGYSFVIQQIQRPSSMKANDVEDFEKGKIADMFTNIDSIKHFGKEKYIKDRFLQITSETKYWMKKNWDYYNWLDAGQSIILSIGTFCLVYFPLVKFIHNEISLGTIVFIYTVYGALIGPLFGFVHGMREYFRVMVDFQSLFEYNKIEQDVKDKSDAQPAKVDAGYIDINKIRFKFGQRQIFDGFSLVVPKNKKYALVGHSGSGKSTLIKLLYRLYDVDEGTISVDGIDIKDVQQESLRAEMSIVPQECVLFDDTIYNNIAFSRPEATRDEVMNAIKFAQLDTIIKEFPQKEETIVGERGVKLSGGEKQRVSIARALLANKKILILDEATSSLDSQTEHDIQVALEKLMKGRTTIIIAHRLSTIMKADMIIVLKKGKIVQKGTHAQLIKKPGEYKKLWNLQKGGYIK